MRWLKIAISLERRVSATALASEISDQQHPESSEEVDYHHVMTVPCRNSLMLA